MSVAVNRSGQSDREAAVVGRGAARPVRRRRAGARRPAAARSPSRTPRPGRRIAEVAGRRRRGRQGRARRRRRGAAGLGGDAAARPRRDPAPGFEMIVDRADDLALLMTLEMGKTLAESKGEITYAAEFFRWFAEEPVRIAGRYSVAPNGATRLLTMKQPVGPCLFVTPWNFPMAMGTRKIGPGDRRRLHDGRQARGADAALDVRARRHPRRGRAAGRRPQRRHHEAQRPAGRAAGPRPAAAQAVVHRLDRGGADARRAVRRAAAAGLDGAGRQRAVPRVRRRRPRRGGRRRDARQDAQHRRGVHGGEPVHRPRVGRRRVLAGGWPSGWARCGSAAAPRTASTSARWSTPPRATRSTSWSQDAVATAARRC